MKISDVPRPSAPSRRTSVATGNGAFKVTADPPESAVRAAESTPLKASGAILALQEVEDELPARKRAVERAHDMLDELEALRGAMLGVGVSEDALDRLSALVGQGTTDVDDPRLQDLLQDVELRAAVELAKRRS